jgi:hypothetical protein
MSGRQSIKALASAVVARAVPVVAVVLAAYVIARWTGELLPVRSFGLFYGDLIRAVGWFGMVSLPVLAWVLWLPTTKLALRFGFLWVPALAGWGWLLHRAWVGTFPVDKLDLYRAYPLVTSAVVVVLVTAAQLWRWRRRRAAFGGASAGTLRSRVGLTLRIVTGCLALVLAVALSSIWTGGPDVG